MHVSLVGLSALAMSVASIAIIDLALSGDNAAVIGLAIKNLPKQQAAKAAIYGAIGAILLRVVFTSLATTLTSLPYMSALGGILLAWITWKLVSQNDDDSQDAKGASSRFWEAVRSIVIADLSMAFDNVLAVAGAAHGSISLVILGLGLSVPILIWGSTWVAALMQKHPLVIYIGAAILAHTSGAMLFHDRALSLTHLTGHPAAVLIPWLLATGVFTFGCVAVTRKENSSKANEG